MHDYCVRGAHCCFGVVCISRASVCTFPLCTQFNLMETKESGDGQAPITTKLILEKSEESGKAVIEVSSRLIEKLKPHQVEGLCFVSPSFYTCCPVTIDAYATADGKQCTFQSVRCWLNVASRSI